MSPAAPRVVLPRVPRSGVVAPTVADGRRPVRRAGRPAVAVTALLIAAALAACQSTRAGGGAATGARAAPVDPQQVVGASESEVARLLGPPELKRQEAPAEVWQYRTSRCVVDVFLYPRAGAARSATHVEARHRRQGSASPAACLGEVAATRGRR